MCQKKFEELKLRDDFMFGKVMRNKTICKKTLEILLGIQIEEVECAKKNEKWRREYMKELLHDFDMKEEGRREGREEGKQAGKQEVNRLNQLLAERNRTDDIIRSAQDEEYQKKLFAEFQI